MARLVKLAPAFAVLLGTALISTTVTADTRGAVGDRGSHAGLSRADPDPTPWQPTPVDSANGGVEFGIDWFNPQPEPPPHPQLRVIQD